MENIGLDPLKNILYNIHVAMFSGNLLRRYRIPNLDKKKCFKA